MHLHAWSSDHILMHTPHSSVVSQRNWVWGFAEILTDLLNTINVYKTWETKNVKIDNTIKHLLMTSKLFKETLSC